MNVHETLTYMNINSYDAAGHVATQISSVMAATHDSFTNLYDPVYPAFATLTTTYGWDSEGRIISMAPSLALPTSRSPIIRAAPRDRASTR